MNMTDAPSFTEMRHSMVASQLRTTGVNDQRVVEAMATVPRERFVPGDAQTNAYRDTPVPLGHGRALNPPLAIGRLLTAAEVMRDDRVLLTLLRRFREAGIEIGTPPQRLELVPPHQPPAPPPNTP